MQSLDLNPAWVYYRKASYTGGISICIIGTHNYMYFRSSNSAKKWLKEKYEGRKVIESPDMFVVQDMVKKS